MSPTLHGERIAIYARFSSDNQKDTSIDDQVRLCTEFVQKNGGVVRPSEVLADYAMSGAVKDRPQFERLQRLVQRKEITVIVAESTDRLSRDLGDSDRLWKLIDFYSVRLICVSDGIDSINEAARMHFRMKAIFADEFLNDLGKKTSRGLQGAASRGTATGGLPLGYTSRRIGDDAAGNGASEILIDEAPAAVVRRIFEMYRDGYSYLTIATTLNNEHVPPPRALSRKRPSKFWKKGTIREMLRNPAYIGEWSFGRKKWAKDPETRRRRYRMQPEEKVRRDDRPHLRIIDSELWEAVKVRRDAVRENYAGKGEGAPGHRTAHPLSGLLFCGVCGHRMVDGGGSSSRAYRCGAAATGGACSNKQRLREDVLVQAAVAELKRIVFDTSLRAEIQAKLDATVANYKVKDDGERKRVERELARVEGETQRLVTFIAGTDPSSAPGAFDAVRASLETNAKERKQLKSRLEALTTERGIVKLPTPEDILVFVRDVEARLRDDPTATREALRLVLGNGKIIMEPLPDGTWMASSMLIIGRLARTSGAPRSPRSSSTSSKTVTDTDDDKSPRTTKPRQGEPSGASSVTSATGEVVEIGSCAGRN